MLPKTGLMSRLLAEIQKSAVTDGFHHQQSSKIKKVKKFKLIL
jgi:hypothetical protein